MYIRGHSTVQPNHHSFLPRPKTQHQQLERTQSRRSHEHNTGQRRFEEPNNGVLSRNPVMTSVTAQKEEARTFSRGHPTVQPNRHVFLQIRPRILNQRNSTRLPMNHRHKPRRSIADVVDTPTTQQQLLEAHDNFPSKFYLSWGKASVHGEPIHYPKSTDNSLNFSTERLPLLLDVDMANGMYQVTRLHAIFQT